MLALSVLSFTLLGMVLGYQPVYSGSYQAGLDVRSLNNLIERDAELYLVPRAHSRVAAAGHLAASAGRGAERATDAAGNLGTALTGVSDFVGMIRGKGKRDLELAARGHRASAAGHYAASAGRGAERATNAAGNVGSALTGISDVVGMFRGGKSRRDLEELDFGLFARDELDMEFDD